VNLFVTRRERCGQMQGRRHETTGGVVTALRRGLGRAENEADGYKSDTTAEGFSQTSSRGWTS
jgi:hypothetical protein